MDDYDAVDDAKKCYELALAEIRRRGIDLALQHWRVVVFSSDCNEDGDCPHCGTDYGACPCLGPTQDGVEYQERDGVLYGRVKDASGA